MKDRDVLRKGEALYRSYKEKDRRAILNEFPYGLESEIWIRMLYG